MDYPTTRQVVRESGRHGAWALIVGIVAVVVVLALGWLIFGVGVLTSDVRGQGEATKAKNSGVNRIAAQERFETLHADVLAADKRIDVLAAALAADKTSQVAQTNYFGAITYCQQVVANYDAEARKYTAREFRSLDLPEQIDPLDPTTDCQETSK